MYDKAATAWLAPEGVSTALAGGSSGAGLSGLLGGIGGFASAIMPLAGLGLGATEMFGGGGTEVSSTSSPGDFSSGTFGRITSPAYAASSGVGGSTTTTGMTSMILAAAVIIGIILFIKKR